MLVSQYRQGGTGITDSFNDGSRETLLNQNPLDPDWFTSATRMAEREHKGIDQAI